MDKKITVARVNDAGPQSFADAKKRLGKKEALVVVAIICNGEESEDYAKHVMPFVIQFKTETKAKINGEGKFELLCEHNDKSGSVGIIPVVMTGDSIDLTLESKGASWGDLGAVIIVPSCKQSLGELNLLKEKKLINDQIFDSAVANLKKRIVVFIKLAKCPHGNL